MKVFVLEYHMRGTEFSLLEGIFLTEDKAISFIKRNYPAFYSKEEKKVFWSKNHDSWFELNIKKVNPRN